MTTLLEPVRTVETLPTGRGAASIRSEAPRRTRRRALSMARLALWRSSAIALFLLIWELAPTQILDAQTAVFLPPLHEDLLALWDSVASGQLLTDVQVSLTRSATGFGIATAIAIPLGMFIAWYRPVETFLNPLLEVFRNTSALALLPVFTLLLGIGETSKITVIAYAAFFPVLLNTISGVRTVDPLLVRAARTLGLSNTALFAKVVLPWSVPAIFTGIRMAATYSILVLIAAEMVGAKAGLGYEIVNAQSSFQIPQMYAAIIATSIVGIVVNTAFVRLERRFSRWRVAATD
jgi:NitT/TauT family transport system permease protein